MYSKQEASLLRQEFWKTFGRYMSPVLSSEGEKINWVNYKTGEKNIRIRTTASNQSAEIAIELSHPDLAVQQTYFEHFQRLREIFVESAGEEWGWILHKNEEARTVSKIYTTLDGVSIFKKEDWPALISFFKPRLIALDEFWNLVRHTVKQLR